jgi:hypothetical protein
MGNDHRARLLTESAIAISSALTVGSSYAELGGLAVPV